MKYYIVDAFADALFKGNQAGVCLLDEWLDTDLLQTIAAENQLAETAYVVDRGSHYDLRWFTPYMEVDLCGHATLATAYILSNIVNQSLEEMNFHTASGILKVLKKGDLFELDFPSRPPLPVSFPPMVEQAIRMPVLEALLARDLFVVVDSEQKVRDLEIDEAILNSIPDLYGLVITTRGETADFVSRYFTPNCYPPEDPVCGSSHSALIPYWAARLGKDTLVAKTLSKRGGTLYCQNCGDRVKISGKGVLYLEGEIRIK